MAKAFNRFALMRLDRKIKSVKNRAKKRNILERHKVTVATNKQIRLANKQLQKSLLSSLTAEEVFDLKLQQALKKYDLKAKWEYRKVNHSLAKSLFEAKEASNEQLMQKLMEENRAAVDALDKKRADYVEKLESKKRAYVQANKVDEKLTQQNKQRFEKDAEEQRRKLRQLYDEKNALATAAIERFDANTASALEELTKKRNALLGSSRKELSDNVILSVKDLCMYFGGLHAVDELSFDVKKGEIFGLIGPNGAGKTTVFNCITQFYKPTRGELLFRNKEDVTVRLTDYSVHDIVLEGISRTFQNVEVIKEVSVLENLLIAATRFYTASVFEQALHLPILKIEEELIKQKAEAVLELLGLSTYKNWYAFGLPYGVLKKIEIARALMTEPKLIILDEPAAGLNDTETAELATLIRRMRKEFDCTILLVEHDMSLVMSVCDRVCAISFGKKLALGTPDEIQADKQVQEAYLGVSDEEGGRQ
ncbi:MAG: ATP-binding cassette domain-containing protein [Clostridia bacterium]|nr:ATP-binding cassette domain-containing protein [Clostridia bacterium]